MKPYRVRRSKIDNLGLYASKNIKKGSKVIEYKGKIITIKEAEENPKYDNDKAIYLFNLNKRYDLDGDFKFNTARLINHSCDPNCEVTGSGLKVWVYAIKDIKKGEEFSYDYGFSFDEDYKNYPCRCRSKNCCGYIVREGSRWRIKKKKIKLNLANNKGFTSITVLECWSKFNIRITFFEFFKSSKLSFVFVSFIKYIIIK